MTLPIPILKLPRPQSQLPSWPIAIGIVLLSASCLGTSWWLWWLTRYAKPEIPQASAASSVVVQTANIRKHAVQSERILTGTVEAMESVTLTSRIPGQVEQILVQEGTQVQTGQMIAIVDVADIQAKRRQTQAQIIEAQAAVATAQANRRSALAQVETARGKLDEAKAALLEAQAELADAQLNQRRMSQLYGEGAIAKANLDTANTKVAVLQAKIAQIHSSIDQAVSSVKTSEENVSLATNTVGQARARISQAEAAVQEVSANLDYGTVRAPFGGTIVKKHVEVGAIAGAGQPLVTLESSDRLRLSVAVPESLINRLKLGQSVNVQLDALKRTVSGRVSQIVPSADPQSRNFTVKIALDATAHMIPGMFGRLKIDTSESASQMQGDRTALTIPTSAIMQRMGITGVFKVVDAKAHFQTVTVQQKYGNQVEVFAGVQEGDRIILHPDPTLIEGTQVRE